MTFEIDAETQAGARLGSGPITTASRLAVTSRVDAAGSVAVDLPATDPDTALFPDNVSRYVRGRAFDASWATVGRGVIKGRTLSSDSKTLKLAGPDIIDELTRTHVGTLQLHDGAGNPMAKASVLGAILAYALPGAGWTSTGVPSIDVYYEFGDETVLAALIKVTEVTGDHFRVEDRTVVWLPTTAAGFVPVPSGLRAVDTGDPDDLAGNPEICLIDGELEEVADDTPRITRIYPRGSGNAGARLYLNGTTRTAPAGYTLHLDTDPAQSYIAYDAAETADGIISHVESLRDISVLGNATTADGVAASNALFDAALPFLQKRLSTQKSYRLRITRVDLPILPGTSIRVVCTHVVDAYRWINVDADFLILEATVTYEAADTSPGYDLQISTVDRWPNDDSAPVAFTSGDLRTITTALRAQKVNAAHVQPAARALASATAGYIAAPVVARYTRATAQNIGNSSTTVVNYSTLDIDTHSRVTTGAAWKFTAAVAGYYHVNAAAIFAASTTWAEVERAFLYLRKNGSIVSALDRQDNYDGAAASVQLSLQGSDIVFLAVGDYCDVAINQNSGGTLGLNADSQQNYVAIHRL